MKFAECMRDNGVPEFPDPDASGELTFDDGVEALDPEAAAWKPAIGACKDLQPPGRSPAKRDPRSSSGAPRVRPVHARQRRAGLPGPRRRRAARRHEPDPVLQPAAVA